jgi:hypothetical protein
VSSAQVPLWVPIIVALLGFIGVLGAQVTYRQLCAEMRQDLGARPRNYLALNPPTRLLSDRNPDVRCWSIFLITFAGRPATTV